MAFRYFSSMTRWRQRLGGEQLVALIQESLSVAHKTGAVELRDLERMAVDTTVQPKAIAHPTDARLMHRALEKLVCPAQQQGVELRQSYVRVAKRAAIMVSRYIHAHQFMRARGQLKFLRIQFGRVIRDIRRKIEGNEVLKARFGQLLDLAVKVSVATPVTQPEGGQFVLHVKALRGNPDDGHTLGPMVADLEKLTGVEARRIHVDKGYRGHSYPNKFRVWISGRVGRTTAALRREMKRRAAVGPVIGHIKAEHRMDRNYLKGRPFDKLRGRPHQRRPCRRRLQFQPTAPLARRALAWLDRDAHSSRSEPSDRLHQRSPAFFTDDCVEQVLAPTLKRGDIVIMDNLGSHKRQAIRTVLTAVGAKLFFLPPYSPDLNPIEQDFAKLKTLLRKAAERTITATWQRIGALLDAFTPQECANYLANSGYASA